MPKTRRKPHPYAEIFPPMDDETFGKFKADIAAHGQQTTVLIYKGMILDGRMREEACFQLGIAPRCVDAAVKDDAEALELVMSLNQHRRHLTLEQSAFASARYANLKKGKRVGERAMTEAEKKVRQRSVSPNGSVDPTGDSTAGVSVLEAAKRFKVSPSSVKRARRIIKHDKATGGDLENKIVSKALSLSAVADELSAAKARSKTVKKPDVKPPKLTTMQALAQRSALAKDNRVLTRGDVDPDFVGSEADFCAKYGLVWSFTARELAAQKFSGLALGLHQAAKNLKELVKGQRGDVEKLNKQPHAKNIERLEEAIDYLKPLLAEAELWLQAAKRLRSTDKVASPVAPRERVTG